MEGLIVLFGELLAMLAALAVPLLFMAVVVAIQFGVAFVSYLISQIFESTDDTKSQLTPAQQARAIATRKWLRRLGMGAAALVVFAVLLLTTLELFFFEPTLRVVCNRLRQKTDISITFDSATGSLWRGRAELSQVRIQREGHALSDFDLAADEVLVDVALLDLLVWHGEIEKVKITKPRGTYTRKAIPEPTGTAKRFEIASLQITDAEIHVDDRTRGRDGFQTRLIIDTLHSAPLRSDWAVYDLLFRSNGQGSIDGAPFFVSSREIPGGRQTRWHTADVPVTSLATYVGGPLEWVESGLIDVDMESRWSLVDADPDVEILFQMVLRDFRAEVPKDTSRLKKSIAVPAVAFMNKHATRLPLEFDLVLNKDQFHRQMSTEAVGLTSAVADGIARELAQRADVDPEKVKAVGNKVKEGLIDWLDRKKKNGNGKTEPQANPALN